MYRVLKQGDVIGVRDADHGSLIFAPDDPILEQAGQLYRRFWQHCGGDPYLGRYHRRLLRKADYKRITATATNESFGDAEATQHWGDILSRVFLEPVFVDTVTGLGWAGRQTLEEMAAACTAWGQHPDAFWSTVYCEAVGWKE